MRKNSEGTMTLLEHLAELRLRLIICVAALLTGAVISFTWVEEIRTIITVPLEGLNLIYLSPPEAFTASLRLAFMGGAVLSSPVIIYQAAAFIFPAFKRSEKLLFIAFLLSSILLFTAGIIFANQVVFPFTINFFLQFASDELVPRFNISDYISFTVSFHLAFGVVFQLPLVTWLLGRLGIVSSSFLRSNRKFALLVMFILAALITPPDVISQVIMVGPLLLLYELGVIMVVWSERKRRKAGGM